MSVEIIPMVLPEGQDTGVVLRLWSRKEYEQAITLGWFTPEEVELRDGELLTRQTGELRLWTRAEYDKASELGWFDGQRVERLYGKVYRKVGQNPPHRITNYLTYKQIERAFSTGFYVDRQSPVPIGEEDDPEPDIFVAQGTWRNYVTRHPGPEDIVLIVEGSDSTLRYDQGLKAAKYAEAGVADYWIADVNARAFHVYRDPVAMPESPSGFGYRSVVAYSEEESLSPLSAPEITLCVADLLLPLDEEM